MFVALNAGLGGAGRLEVNGELPSNGEEEEKLLEEEKEGLTGVFVASWRRSDWRLVGCGIGTG